MYAPFKVFSNLKTALVACVMRNLGPEVLSESPDLNLSTILRLRKLRQQWMVIVQPRIQMDADVANFFVFLVCQSLPCVIRFGASADRGQGRDDLVNFPLIADNGPNSNFV